MRQFMSEILGGFSDKTQDRKSVKTIDFKLKSRIYGGGRGSAFTPNSTHGMAHFSNHPEGW
jgi:hypothetical protein